MCVYGLWSSCIGSDHFPPATARLCATEHSRACDSSWCETDDMGDDARRALLHTAGLFAEGGDLAHVLRRSIRRPRGSEKPGSLRYGGVGGRGEGRRSACVVIPARRASADSRVNVLSVPHIFRTPQASGMRAGGKARLSVFSSEFAGMQATFRSSWILVLPPFGL